MDAEDRDLTGAQLGQGYTPETCGNACEAQNFPYFGVQAGGHCFCGNSFGKHGSGLESECNRKCKTSESEICGGSWRNSVYATGVAPGNTCNSDFADDLIIHWIKNSNNLFESLRRVLNLELIKVQKSRGHKCY